MSTTTQLNGKVDSIVPVTNTWTSSGPAAVAFLPNANTVDAQAVTTTAGTYTLTLTSYVTAEPILTTSDSMTLTTVVNTAPVANAGAAFTTFTNQATRLAGSSTYAGFYPPVTYKWIKFSGTGTVTFVNDTSANTNVTIGSAGTFVLRLTASDGASPPLSTHSDVTVTVQANPGTHSISATPANPTATLGSVDVEYRVDLSVAGAANGGTFWTAMNTSNGADIRVTDGSNNIIPFDVVDCTKLTSTTGTGFVVYKRTGVAGTASQVKIWCGGTGATTLDPNDPNGQYNAYRSDCVAFYPDGGGSSLNRTRNSLNLSVVGAPVVTSDNSGAIGANKTTYTTSKYAFRQSSSFAAPMTFSCAMGVTFSGSQIGYGGGVSTTSNGTINSDTRRFYVKGSLVGSDQTCTAGEVGYYTSPVQEVATVTSLHGAWAHYSGTVATNGTQRVAISDASFNTDNTALTSNLAFDYLVIGARPKLTPTQFSTVSTPISLVSVYSTQLSDVYLKYQGKMLDQAGFYGTWTYA